MDHVISEISYDYCLYSVHDSGVLEVGCGNSKPSEIDWAPGIITTPSTNQQAACSWRLNTTINRVR